MQNFFLLLFLLCSFGAQAQTRGEKIITGTVLLNDQTFPTANRLKEALQKDWGVRPDSIATADKTLILTLPDATVMVAFLDYPVPANEIYTASAISWLWKDADAATRGHQGQVVVSVLGSPQRTVQLYQLFTRVSAAILSTSNASGVFMNGQLLLLSKGYYLESARGMSEQILPVNCWVYFGLMEEEGKAGAFTYGLQEFGFPELEITGSQHSMTEVLEVISAAARYILQYSVQLKDDQTIPLDSGLKIPVKLTDAVFLESGKSFKLEF